MSIKSKVAALLGFSAGLLTGGFLVSQGEPTTPPAGSKKSGRENTAAMTPVSSSVTAAREHAPASVAPVGAAGSANPFPLAPPRLKLGIVGMTRFVVAIAIFAIVSTALGIAGMKYRTNLENQQEAIALTGGDPDRGSSAISNYGCASCHTIPGIHGATGLVGPPLTSIGSRMYIGGVLANTPDNLTRWIKNAPAVDPMTAMPNLNVSDQDARDIACYLYTLR